MLWDDQSEEHIPYKQFSEWPDGGDAAFKDLIRGLTNLEEAGHGASGIGTPVVSRLLRLFSMNMSVPHLLKFPSGSLDVLIYLVCPCSLTFIISFLCSPCSIVENIEESWPYSLLASMFVSIPLRLTIRKKRMAPPYLL
jgi:hypothetical protein